jgi:hypothetical protein
MSEAEAFVLTNAFAGVMRAMLMRPEDAPPPQGEIERALARLMSIFVGERRSTAFGQEPNRPTPSSLC